MGKDFNILHEANLVAYSFIAEDEVFLNVEEHGCGEDAFDSHKYKLIRLVAAKYMECRLYNECKEDKADRDGEFRVSKNQMNRITINRHT